MEYATRASRRPLHTYNSLSPPQSVTYLSVLLSIRFGHLASTFFFIFCCYLCLNYSPFLSSPPVPPLFFSSFCFPFLFFSPALALLCLAL
ncbi:hypothetical protein DFJ73DRAFT_848058, partial [Zopfochytrium polystomum]